MRKANQVLGNLGPRAKVHFKFSCDRCGQRNMFQEPNKLFESGECIRCGYVTEVVRGGYLLDIGGDK
jgi:hypothetical protein